MERTDCCVVGPSRGTAPGVAGRVLTAAWRALAELGGPACVLRQQSGVLAVAWVNRALSELLAMDAGQLAGRPLRDLVDADREPIAPDEAAPPGWAVAVHRLARDAGGSAPARLVGGDGIYRRVQLHVTPVVPPEPLAPSSPTVAAPGVLDLLPAPADATCWLVTLDPVTDVVVDLQ